MNAPAPRSQPDIVIRLRAAECGDWRVTAVASICGDAADEIAALRSRVEELTKALAGLYEFCAMDNEVQLDSRVMRRAASAISLEDQK